MYSYYRAVIKRIKEKKEEIMPEQTINITDAIIIIVLLFVSNLPTLIKVIKEGSRTRKMHKENNSELKDIKNYIRDKGVDDFCVECKKWERRKYITPLALGRLTVRYKDLGKLGADGERDAHWNAIQKLEISEKKPK